MKDDQTNTYSYMKEWVFHKRRKRFFAFQRDISMLLLYVYAGDEMR